MISEDVLKRIDQWFDDHREELITDLKRIVRIPSVSAKGEEGGPYGRGCKEALDEMLQIGREHGFHTESYEDYVGSIGLKEKNLNNTIGFWNHMDIVPIGNNWKYDPFEATLEGPFLIGRGVSDNKGPAVGMLYLMQCLRELNIPMNHELCLYVGCDEEKGMSDLKYYVENYETPAISIVADAAFPVCYGEKGIMEGEMVTKKNMSEHFTAFKGGVASNMIPDRVACTLKGDEAFVEKLCAELEKLSELAKAGDFSTNSPGADTAIQTYFVYECGEGEVTITLHGMSRHSGNPYGSTNSIYGLCKVLSQLTVLADDDQENIRAIMKMSEGYLGEAQGITYKDEVSGDTTCAATMIDLRDGKLCLNFNIRYAITADDEKDMASLAASGEKYNLMWVLKSNSKPNYFPKENPIVDLLTDVFNQATGQKAESYVMGGGTYARKLPNAFVYGLGGIAESEEDKALRSQILTPGHGGAHEPDEILNLNSYFTGLKVFARAMIALNDVAI